MLDTCLGDCCGLEYIVVGFIESYCECWWRSVLVTTLCDQVWRVGGCPRVLLTNKSDCHDKTEIIFKMALHSHCPNPNKFAYTVKPA